MIIFIDELESNPDKKIDIHFDEIIKDLNNNQPVIGNITAVSTGVAINITGTIETTLTLECDRCLKEYQYQIKINLDENFVKGTIIEENKSEIEIKQEDFVEELGDSNEINLTDLIYQNIIVNTPIQKLCDKNCKGSEVYQEIKEEVIDPRLQIFKDISDEMK